MALTSIANLLVNQITGFALWLILIPFRAVVSLLDPIMTPIMSPLESVVGFVSTVETLKGFFTDVNYFIPFAAATAIIRATFGIAFVCACALLLGGTTFGTFQNLLVDLVKAQLRAIGDFVTKCIHALFGFFFG